MTSSPRSTRRDFLQGKSAADALAGLADRVGSALPEPGVENYLLRVARRAMACEFEFLFNAGQYPQAGEAAVAALDLVDQIEDQLTVYRDHSEISLLNRIAAERPLIVEPRLFDLLRLAVEIHARTGGAYDVTAGPLSRTWGFMRRAGAIPAADVLAAARENVGSFLLKLDPELQSVRFTQAGVELNLGSIGKGYALDRAAELLEAAGVRDFLLHGGNSSVLARGAHGGLPAEQGWLVGVRDPHRPQRRAGQLRLVNRALATSGSGTQFFIHEGARYGHILDPRTGWPAQGVLSTSVLAATAAEADALSTAFYVLGPEAAQQYCAQHADVAAVMHCPGPRAGSVARHLFNLAQDDWTELGE
jgi:thiamine biosynthesis lipoprotein